MSILNPMTFFWLFLAASFILYKFNRKKAGKVFIILGLLQLLLFSVTPLPVYMIHRLEQQYPVYKTQQDEKLPILVLGNYHADDDSLYPSQKLSIQALERVTEGLRIYKSSLGSSITFSGYAVNKKVPTAVIMAETAISLGVSPKDTLMLPSPRNTWEEALAYKKRFGTKSKFILVTSATHMPRAMKVFRSMGMQPVAAPAGFFIKEGTNSAIYNWWPSSTKILYTEMAIYEYAAQVYYRWLRQ